MKYICNTVINWTVSFQNSYIEECKNVTPQCAIFRHRAFKGVSKVK